MGVCSSIVVGSQMIMIVDVCFFKPRVVVGEAAGRQGAAPVAT